jgi:hypothetical protein
MFLAQLLKRDSDVVGGDLISFVGVKLVENCPQPLVREELLHVDGRVEELAVIDLAITVEVNLFDQLLNLSVAHIYSLLLDVLAQLSRVNHALTVLVHLLKDLSQVYHLFRFYSLN